MKEAWSAFFDSVYSIFNQILFAITSLGILDILDIIIVAFIVYKAIEFLRESRAALLLKGILILLVVSAVANLFDLVSMKWLLDKLFDYALIAVVVIFQPELRRALEKVGRSNLSTLTKGQLSANSDENIKACVDAICKSVVTMSDKRIGALIVFERKTMLGDIANTGTILNCETSYEMVGNIFFPKSPLHDGALIVRDGRLYAAGCILPLTSNNNLNSQLGTRHRAAIGMSENSDAVVLVVSEETGTISIAMNGTIKRDYNSVTLKEELFNQLLDQENVKSKTSVVEMLEKTVKNIFKKK